MGVPGLWDILKPAAHVRSLTDIAIKDGFEANPDGKRGFRIGIDASIWFFHAEYSREGENPVLRTLFFRCATLMHTTFLPIFVFDGPKRPDIKRGKKINRAPHKLITGMKQIVEAFGFEWRMAPGEAEAELAYLNRIGVIDAVLSDDVDNFLFGATMVIRNTSNTLSGNRANPALNAAGKDDGNHARVFRIEDISNHPDVLLTRGGMILIGLMSGGDYEQGGLARFGISTAHGLAKCGFGDTLYEAARTMDRDELAEFLVSWRQGLRHELRTNSQKVLGHKFIALSKAIPENFPDIDILLSYVDPITSESMGRESINTKLTWSKEPNVSKLAETCELYFEWGYKEAIVKRFRTVIWHSIVLRILRRAVLDLDAKITTSENWLLHTPRKKKPAREGILPCGTPSKMIARHFASLGINSPQKHGSDESSEEEENERLIMKIHSTRTHVSTDGLLEYRLEIAPGQLVRLAEAGVRGLRQPEGPDEWASEKEDDDDDVPKKGKGKQVDPQSHLRVWMPACMVSLAEPALVQQYDEKEEEKKQKKANKGTRRVAAVKDTTVTTKEKRPRKTTKKTTTAPALPFTTPSDLDDDLFVSPGLQGTRAASPIVEPPRAIYISLSDDDGDPSDSSLPSPCRLFAIPKPVADVHDLPLVPLAGTSKTTGMNTQDDFLFSPVSTRTGIKDLTKKKPVNLTTNMKALYPIIQKPTTPSKTNAEETPANLIVAKLMIVPDSEPARAKLRTSLQDKGIPIDFGVPSMASMSSLPEKTYSFRSNILTLQNIQHPETDTLSLSDDDYNPIIWGAQPAGNKPGLSSPSKRKPYTHASSHSESEHTGHQHKSPRKYTTRTATECIRRPQSPTPTPSASRPPIKTSRNIIEISDSSDSDALPTTTNVRNLPPLLAARARAQARAASKTSSTSSASTVAISSQPSKGKYLMPYSDDIIDLT